MTYYTVAYQVPCYTTISFESEENLTREQVLSKLKEQEFSSLDIDIDNSYGEGIAEFCLTQEAEWIESDSSLERLV